MSKSGILNSLELQIIDIPFNVKFKHASAERERTESIWVTAISQDKNIGYGEGCPRKYVTGESIKTAKLFFRENKNNLIQNITDLKSLMLWAENHKIKIDDNPAAWCAIELAILELIAKTQNKSVDSLLGLPEINRNFHYTAVIGDSDKNTFQKTLNRYIKTGFTDYKIKLSGDFVRDNQHIQLIHKNLSENYRIRLDANNLWNEAEFVLKHITDPDKIFAIEEPLQQNDYSGFQSIYQLLETPIILDESFLKEEQFIHLKSNPNAWIINLRISKMGGLLRSLQIVKRAKELNIPVIIGAQVGETSLLTRAALTVANFAGNNCIAQEGAFGTLLLQQDICDKPLMFGSGGKLTWNSAIKKNNIGFGIQYNIDKTYIKTIYATK